ncbi:glycosyltransferase family 2 protein [Patescibacteria group bacterium]|nr:glycosyltransferase family 2 protein [Patescibacteria group bacterium]
MTKKLVSIVIPCYNEEGNIKRFQDDLITPLRRDTKFNFEFIAVDDGSKDKTWEELKKVSQSNENFLIARHSKNYGMGASYQTAFDLSKGEYVVTFSSDFEIPYQAILTVLEKLEEGYDVVNTNRSGRWKEKKSSGILRKIPSSFANFLIKKISGVEVKDTGSGLKGFRRFVIENLKIYGDMHRFLPSYSSLYTKKIVEIPVTYQERTFGKSSYGSIKRTFSVFLDLFSMKFMLSFSTKPFTMMPGRIFGTVGIAISSLGTFITLFLLGEKFLLGQSIGSRPLFTIGLIFIVVGIQLVMTGLLGELLLRIYFESSGRKPYIVSEKYTNE